MCFDCSTVYFFFFMMIYDLLTSISCITIAFENFLYPHTLGSGVSGLLNFELSSCYMDKSIII